jgi:tripartite-type tricarboxylate transporter receptor subunit TctC
MFNKHLPHALLMAASMAIANFAYAQSAGGTFPSKTITLVVPYAAGGSSDTRARQIAAKMATHLGQSVIVENKPGAAGNIGTDYIAKATPDGHVIGIGNLAPLAVNKAMLPKMPFDPATDITPVALVEKGPLVLLVSAERSPVKTLADLLAVGKTRPDALSYASAGSGGAFHLAGELLEDASGVKMLHVPYKGGGPATTDMLAGTVSFMFDMVPAALPYLKPTPPKARALAVAAAQRLPQLPDVPTFAELGYKNFEVSNWFGVIAPKGTPAPVVAQLNDAVNRALRDPDIAERITGQGNVMGGGSAQEFAAFISSETARWAKIIKDKNITPN